MPTYATRDPFGSDLKYITSELFLHDQPDIATYRSISSRVLDSNSDPNIHDNDDFEFAFRRGIATPFFFKPNIVIDPQIIAEKLPLWMKYGRSVTADRNVIGCCVQVRNVPPKGYRRFFTAKGKASARHLGAALLTQAVGEPMAFIAPLRWIALVERPALLPELPNDGMPIPVHFLEIRLDDHSIVVADSPDDTIIHYLLPNEYDLSIRVGKELCKLGRFKLPEDLVSIAKKKERAMYAVQSGGYVVYLEKDGDDVVLNCEGKITDEELTKLNEQHHPSRILLNSKPYAL